MKNKKEKTYKLVHGEPCPLCNHTLEWSYNKECENCGYDKP
jgi:hypothetical protein